MIVQLKKKNSRYRDLTLGQPYAVIGIEADDYRILNDAGRPFLYPKTLFTKIDSEEPSDWVTEFGEDQERYSYPSALNKPGFFEDFFDENPTAVAAFWQLVNQRLPPPSGKGRPGLAEHGSLSSSSKSVTYWDLHVYAEAGLALQWAQLFEAEIVTVLVVYGVSRQQFGVRSEAEDFIRKAEKRPLSQLLHDILKRVKFEPDIAPTFEEAISARNSLVHHFFWDRSRTFAEEPDQSKLLGELRELTLLFFSAYKFAELLRDLYVQQLDETQIQKILSEEMSSLQR